MFIQKRYVLIKLLLIKLLALYRLKLIIAYININITIILIYVLIKKQIGFIVFGEQKYQDVMVRILLKVHGIN